MNTTLRRTLIAASTLTLGVGLFLSAQTGSASGGTTTTTAAQVADRFQNAGLPISQITNLTAETDKNHLLGRTGGYTSKIMFTDNRITDTREGIPAGGSIEVYPTHAEARERGNYIAIILTKLPALGPEYDYITDNAVIRISGQLTPEQAKAYRDAANH